MLIPSTLSASCSKSAVPSAGEATPLPHALCPPAGDRSSASPVAASVAAVPGHAAGLARLQAPGSNAGAVLHAPQLVVVVSDTLPKVVPRRPEEYVYLEDAPLPPVPSELWGSVILDKPWVTYDLETTGLLPEHPRVLEIGCVVTRPDGTRRSFTSLVKPDINFADSNSIKIHRIMPAHVATAPTLSVVTAHLASFLAREAPNGYVLGGFNIQGFDNAVLREDLARQRARCPFGRIPELDVKTAFRSEEPPKHSHDARTLKSAVRRFCSRTQATAHGAKSDAIDASDVLFGIARDYGTPDMCLSDWVKRYENAKPSRFRFVLSDLDLWDQAA